MPYKHKRTGETRAEMPPAYRVKFSGKTCTKCNKPLVRGEVHQWDKTRKGVDYHQDCLDTRHSPWEYVASESSNGTSEQSKLDCPYCHATFHHADNYQYHITVCTSKAKQEEQTTNTQEEQASDMSNAESNGELGAVLAHAIEKHLDLGKLDASKLLDQFQAKFDALAQEFHNSVKTIQVTNVTVTNELGEVKDCGTQHKQFPKLVKMLSARDHKRHRLNIWIAGPAGTGKTSAAEHAAKALGLDFASTGALTESYKIFGFIAPGTGNYVPTPFRKIWEQGGVFLFDDCDASDPNVLTEFNNALANGGCTFPDGYIPRNPDCVIVLTANTWGLGATNDYVGRMKQDAAFLDRFAKLYWPIDENLELATAPIESWTRRVQQVRERCKDKGIKVLVTPRASYYGAALLQAGLCQSEVEESVLKGAMSEDQWTSVR